jgi:hypothetical protein
MLKEIYLPKIYEDQQVCYYIGSVFPEKSMSTVVCSCGGKVLVGVRMGQNQRESNLALAAGKLPPSNRNYPGLELHYAGK